MTTIALMNVKGGVGKTTLAYHLTWMFAELGLNVLAVDLDPQANLSTMFLPEKRLRELWRGAPDHGTLHDALQVSLHGGPGGYDLHVERVATNIGLLVGDVRLAAIEPELGPGWIESSGSSRGTASPLPTLSRVVAAGSRQVGADVVLLDLPPTLSGVTRAALIAASHVVIPVSTDHLSTLSLKVLGPALRRWLQEGRGIHMLDDTLRGQDGKRIAGYVVRMDLGGMGPSTATRHGALRELSASFHRWVLSDGGEPAVYPNEDDPYLLGQVRQYRSLMELARDAHKPIFLLTPADGALGSHSKAVQRAYKEFRDLARTIADRCSLSIPPGPFDVPAPQ